MPMRTPVGGKLDADIHSREKAIAKYVERDERREASRRVGIRAWEDHQEGGS